MKRRTFQAISILIFMAVVCAWTAGCSGLSRPYPERSAFGLKIQRPDNPSEAPEGAGTLKVVQTRVVSPYDGRSFVYRVGANQYETDYYNIFITTPNRLITGLLVDTVGDDAARIAVTAFGACPAAITVAMTLTGRRANR